jgi:hypothetical protein
VKVNSQLERAQLENVTSVPSPATAGRIVFDTIENTIKIDTGSAWRNVLDNTSGQSGSGFSNYMPNSNFESGTVTGWQLFSLAGYIPGSFPLVVPTLGFASSLTAPTATNINPINGTYSLSLKNAASTNFTAGDGIVSPVMTTTRGDFARIISNKLQYVAENGSSFMSFSGTSAGTFGLFIYDVTNSKWVSTINGSFNFVQGAGVGEHVSSWQTAASQIQFRMAILCLNTTAASSPAAGALELKIDELFIGKQAFLNAPAMTDMVKYTPVITGFGTVSDVGFFSRRVGDSLEIYGTFTAGTTTATQAKISIGHNGANGNVVVDSSKILASPAGIYQQVGYATLGVSTANTYPVLASESDTSGLFMGVTSPTSAGAIPQQGILIVMPGGSVTFFAQVPIAGWSSNTVSSLDVSSRSVKLIASQSTPQAIPNVTQTQMTFDTPSNSKDSHGGFLSSSYHVKVPGDHFVAASSSIAATSGYGFIYIVLNGSLKYQGYGISSPTHGLPLSVSGLLDDLKVNDQIRIDLYHDSSGSPATINGVQSNYFNISGPSALPLVQSADRFAFYIGGGPPTTASFGTIQTVVFPSPSSFYINTHNAINFSNGEVTVPSTGFLFVGAAIAINDNFITANYEVTPIIYKNGFAVARLRTSASAGFNGTMGSGVCGLVPVSAGDKISLRQLTNGAGASFVPDESFNYFYGFMLT